MQVSHSPATIWNSVNLGLPYFALAAACNVTITLTIATPLLLHRRSLTKMFGRNNEYSRQYTSAAAILVESSAVYAIVAIIFIGFYARNNPISHIFLSTLCQVQVCAHLSPYFSRRTHQLILRALCLGHRALFDHPSCRNQASMDSVDRPGHSYCKPTRAAALEHAWTSPQRRCDPVQRAALKKGKQSLNFHRYFKSYLQSRLGLGRFNISSKPNRGLAAILYL